MSDRVALAMACLTLALELKVGSVDETTLTELHARALRLPIDDPVRQAMTQAVVALEVASPDRKPAIGETLQRQLQLALMPAPPDAGRADIHG